MASVNVNGIKLNYDVAGKGKSAVICIHGVMGSCKQWKYLLDALKSEGGYKVYAPDLRGYGDSDKPRGEYDRPTFVKDLHAFMDAFNIQKATLVGYSLGSIIMMSFAEKYPERIERLIIVGNAVRVPRTSKILISVFFSPLILTLKSMTGRMLARHFFTNLNEKTLADFNELVNDIKRAPAFSQIKSWPAGMGVDYLDVVKQMNVPVLGIFAALDRMVSLDQADALRKCIRKGKVEIIKNSGHMPMLEQPEEFNRIVIKFLKERDE